MVGIDGRGLGYSPVVCSVLSPFAVCWHRLLVPVVVVVVVVVNELGGGG